MKRTFGLCLAIIGASVSALAVEPGADASGLAMGIALEQPDSLEENGRSDIAAALQRALEEQGVGRVESTQSEGIEALGPAANGIAQRLAASRGLSAVVVGRVTRLGGRLSVDVRLRSGHSGAVLGTYVAEVALDEALEPAMQSLAEQLVLGALSRSEPEAPPGPSRVATRPPSEAVIGAGANPPAPAPQAAREPSPAPVPFGLAGNSELPVSIRSGELEASEQDGVRILTFGNVVEAVQGELQLDAQELVARYPQGDKQPSKLEARGDVRVRQQGSEAFCAEASYDREREQIDCQGAARIHYAGDEITGEHMTFDLAGQGLVVDGDAAIRLAARTDRSAWVPLDDATEEAAPLVARSERLHAEQDEEMRRIILEGGVEIVQGDLTLRSERLELFYPENAQHPERIEALGSVEFLQGSRRATCERAIYREDPHGIDCLEAALSDAGDRIAGEHIHFDLERGRVRAEGTAKLVLAPRPRGAGETNP